VNALQEAGVVFSKWNWLLLVAPIALLPIAELRLARRLSGWSVVLGLVAGDLLVAAFQLPGWNKILWGELATVIVLGVLAVLCFSSYTHEIFGRTVHRVEMHGVPALIHMLRGDPSPAEESYREEQRSETDRLRIVVDGAVRTSTAQSQARIAEAKARSDQAKAAALLGLLDDWSRQQGDDFACQLNPYLLDAQRRLQAGKPQRVFELAEEYRDQGFNG